MTTTTTKTTTTTPRRRVFGVLRLVACLLVVGLLVHQVWQVRGELGPNLRSVGWPVAILAMIIAGVGAVPGFFGWRMLLGALGTRVTVPAAAAIFFPAQLTRYLPGGVWPGLVTAAGAKSIGESPFRLTATFVASHGLAVVAGLAVSLIALPQLVATSTVWWVLPPLLLIALIPLAAPALPGAVLTGVMRVLRRDVSVPAPVGRRTLVAVTAVTAVGWLISGVHVAILAIALGAAPADAIATGIGGFALSVIAGALAVVLPSGLGVRELVLGLTLGPLLSGAGLVTLIALSRVLTTAGDLVVTSAILGLVNRMKGR